MKKTNRALYLLKFGLRQKNKGEEKDAGQKNRRSEKILAHLKNQ